MTKIAMRILLVAGALAALLLPVGLRAQEPDPASLDSLRVRIEEVSRRQMEEIRRIQEASQVEIAALRSALEAERGRISEAQRSLTEAERALVAVQGGATPASTTVRMYRVNFQQYVGARYPQQVEPGSFVTFAGDNLGGAKMVTLNPALAAYFAVEEGVLIVDVAEETPAARSGLRAGDVILEVAGTEITDIQGISRMFEESPVQGVLYTRGGQPAQELRSGMLAYPLPLRIVREGRQMEIVLEP